VETIVGVLFWIGTLVVIWAIYHIWLGVLQNRERTGEINALNRVLHDLEKPHKTVGDSRVIMGAHERGLHEIAYQIGTVAEEIELGTRFLDTYVQMYGRDEVREALEYVDWYKVIMSHSTATLVRITEHGSRFQMGVGIRASIESLAKSELSQRG
jgi:gamma-glutamyl phosphate reductase